MAFTTGDGRGVRSEIYITPLVDVVLVLLIIFMVMTPVLLKKLDLNVPEKVDTDVQVTASEQLVVSVAADSSVSINKELVPRDALGAKLSELLQSRRDKVVFFDVDDTANYADVVAVMDVTRGAGAKVLGIMTKD
jgi:biopolymer transport protein ExbD